MRLYASRVPMIAQEVVRHLVDKQLIAVAVAHVTQCPWCIDGHVKAARRAGASNKQIMEAIWVAAEMRAGAAYAHSIKTLELMDED